MAANMNRTMSRRIGTSMVKSTFSEVDVAGNESLVEELQMLNVEDFDADKFVISHCNDMSEMSIRLLCTELMEHRRYSTEEMRRSVYTNYTSFIRTSKEIADLEDKLQAMRILLSMQATLVSKLYEGYVDGGPHPVISEGLPATHHLEGHLAWPEEREPTPAQRRALELPDILDSLVAERKVEEALAKLKEGDQLVAWAESKLAKPRLMKLTCISGSRSRGRQEDVDSPRSEQDGSESTSAGDAEEREQEDEANSVADVSEEQEEEAPMSAQELQVLREELAERRRRLVEHLVFAAQQPSVSGQELRDAVGALAHLGEGLRAHTLLLASHGGRLQRAGRELRSSKASYGGGYTAALSQLTFSAVWQAARDSEDLFRRAARDGGGRGAFASELIVWARAQTTWCAGLLARHVLSSGAAAGGLRAAAECARIALSHCLLLEREGLCLGGLLSRLLKDSLEDALEAAMWRIKESVATMAAVDNWHLVPPPEPAAGEYSANPFPPLEGITVSSSAWKLVSLLQDLVDDVAPALTMHMVAPTLDKMAQVFEFYVKTLQKALPGGDDNEDTPVWEAHSVRTAFEKPQQLALLANAIALADNLLPELSLRAAVAGMASRNSSMQEGEEHAPEKKGRRRRGRSQNGERSINGEVASAGKVQKAFRRRCQVAVESLRVSLCTCFAAEMMYSEEGELILSPYEYVVLDAQMSPEEWQESPFPSQPFQELCAALGEVGELARSVLTGRPKSVTTLLVRLTESIVMGLMGEEAFWEILEHGDYALGPSGLQQIVMDMYFIMQFAANGKHSSRTMRQVALESMARVITLYQDSTGHDPTRVLQPDDWFQDKCQKACEYLAGHMNGEAEQEEQSGSGDAAGERRRGAFSDYSVGGQSEDDFL